MPYAGQHNIRASAAMRVCRLDMVERLNLLVEKADQLLAHSDLTPSQVDRIDRIAMRLDVVARKISRITTEH